MKDYDEWVNDNAERVFDAWVNTLSFESVPDEFVWEMFESDQQGEADYLYDMQRDMEIERQINEMHEKAREIADKK